MTTIAWDGHTIACDQGAWSGERVGHAVKLAIVEIRKDNDFGKVGDKLIVAHMGLLWKMRLVELYLSGVSGELDVSRYCNEEEVVAIVIDKHRRVLNLSPWGDFVQEGCCRNMDSHYSGLDDVGTSLPDGHSVWSPDYFAAWGSGGNFATGALAAGATADKAIELAIKYTDRGHYGVSVIKWSEVFGPKSAGVPAQFPDDGDKDFPF